MELDTDRRQLLSSEGFVSRELFQMLEVITSLVLNNDTRRKNSRTYTVIIFFYTMLIIPAGFLYWSGASIQPIKPFPTLTYSYINNTVTVRPSYENSIRTLDYYV